MIDKEYGDWLELSAAHPAPAAPSGARPLPHAIDWRHVWGAWEDHVESTVPTWASPAQLFEPHAQSVRDIVTAVREEGERRLRDAAATVRGILLDRPSDADALEAALTELHVSLSAPLDPLGHVNARRLAERLDGAGDGELSLGDLALAVQRGIEEGGAPSTQLNEARHVAASMLQLAADPPS